MSDSAEALYIRESAILFQQYREVVKPLLALVEAVYEKFPIPVYNEVRAFTDHLSRCYGEDGAMKSVDDVRGQLEKASHHIKRTIYDLYKLLIISGKKELESFERRTRRLDLRTVDSDGSFSAEFIKMRERAIELTVNAKMIEAKGDAGAAYEAYDKAYLAYLALHKLIINIGPRIRYAKAKWYVSKLWAVVAFVIGAILSPYIESAWRALVEALF